MAPSGLQRGDQVGRQAPETSYAWANRKLTLPPGPINGNLGRQLLNLVDYLDKVYDAGNRRGVKKAIRALRRLLVGDRAAGQ